MLKIIPPQILVLSMVMSVAATANAQADFTMFRAARHAGVTNIPDSTISSAYTDASSAFQSITSPNDVACPLTLQSVDPGEWWYSADNITSNVNSQTSYVNHQANAAHGYYLIVNAINWCGATGAVGGCGWPNGGKQPFIVTNALATSAQRGVVMAHEFGHTTGLNHEQFNNPSPLPLQIMDQGALSTSNVKVKDAATCASFRTVFTSRCPAANDNPSWLTSPAVCSTGGLMTPASTAASAGSSATEAETDYSNVPIKQLALSFFVDRVPAEVEDYYAESDVKTLIAMLQDPANRQYQRTIVSLIGLISDGSNDDLGAIQSYAKTATGGDLDAAFIAVGYLVSRHGNQAALDALVNSAVSNDPGTVEAATLGLGVSGHARALAKLRELGPGKGEQSSLRATAVRDNQKIAKSGLRAYYRQVETKTEVPSLVNPQAGHD